VRKFVVFWFYLTTFTVGLYSMIALIIVLGTGIDVDLGKWEPILFGVLRVAIGVGTLALLLRAGVLGNRIGDWVVPNSAEPPRPIRASVAIFLPLVFWAAVLVGIWLLSQVFKAD
jgi:hypothetical protein